MSVFGPNQVEELMIGNAKGAAADVAAFIASAADKEVQLLSKDGGAIAAGKKFYALQKTAGSAGKNLNYEFSDEIDPKSIDSVRAVKHAAELPREIFVQGFDGNVIQNATYEVFVRLYNDGGTLSTENFRFIYGNFVTDANYAGTAEEIVDGIVDSLNKAISQSYTDSGSFVFAKEVAPTLGIQILALNQDNDPARNVGRPIEFDVQVSVKDNCNSGSCSTPAVHNVLDVVIREAGFDGVGTARIISNLEWFTKGYKYEAYRDTGYPVNFNTPYYADKASHYNVIHINYFKERKYTNVEKQHRVLSIAIAEAYVAPVAEVSTIQVTAAATVAGTATVDLNGATVNLPLTASTIAINAGEIASAINATGNYAAISDGVDTVTITSLNPGAEVNIASYAAGTATSSAATLATTVDGVDESMDVAVTNSVLADIRTITGLTLAELPDLV